MKKYLGIAEGPPIIETNEPEATPKTLAKYYLRWQSGDEVREWGFQTFEEMRAWEFEMLGTEE